MRENKLPRALPAALALFALVSSARGQVAAHPVALSSEATVAVGPSTSALTLFTVSGSSPQAAPVFPSAGGFQILPIDLAGRLDFFRFDPTRPRRIVTDDGLSRISLPE